MGVRNHIRQHFPEKGVDRHRDHDAGKSVAGQAQLGGTGRRDRRDAGDDQVEQGDVEGDPRQVGAHRPGDRQPLPEGEQRERREGDEGDRVEARAARRQPDPDGRQRQEDEYDRSRPGKDIPAREEREREYGGQDGRNRHRRCHAAQENAVGPARGGGPVAQNRFCRFHTGIIRVDGSGTATGARRRCRWQSSDWHGIRATYRI